MHDRIYRGTSFEMAKDAEFSDGQVRGRQIDLVTGFIDPDDVDEDWAGGVVDDLPWELGPDYGSASIVGGLSNRLGAAASFAAGGIPLVFHFREGQLPTIRSVRYEYDWFNGVEGAMAWVDGVATGELRINEDLRGLLVDEGDAQRIRYYENGVRDRARQYNEEMEQIITGNDRVDISGATRAVVSYINRPVAALASRPGYARLDTKMTTDETIVGDWSDERALRELFDIVNEAAPEWAEVWVAQINKVLAMERWGFQPEWVDRVIGPEGEMDGSQAPEWLLGD